MADDSNVDNNADENKPSPLSQQMTMGRVGWGLLALGIGFFGGLLALASIGVLGGIIGVATLAAASYCVYKVFKPEEKLKEKCDPEPKKCEVSNERAAPEQEQDIKIPEPERIKAPAKPEKIDEPQVSSELADASASKAIVSAGRSVG